jgi:glycosyltransferase involved in cell wall biosynthesis
MKKLFIISNESIFKIKEEFYCDNLDMKSLPEGLNDSFEVTIIARKSKKNRSHKIVLKNINIFSNLFSYLKSLLKSVSDKNTIYLIISISPFTFFACVLLRIFKRKPYVYLRSDGFSEYKSILGPIGPFLYQMMFFIIVRFASLISCRDYILRGRKGQLVNPSQLSDIWFKDYKEINIENIKLLYVGRIKKEKGIFSLLNILKNKSDINLSIVGAEKTIAKKINQNNVKIFEIENNEKKLINFYDNHNIFVLPSFTEGHPMSLLEALARKRPVIIFKEIEHVVNNKIGIFIAERNYSSFIDKVNYIKQNYKNIQDKMEDNVLPTKFFFLKQIKDILKNENK